jgi:transposase-like protein
MNKKHHYILTNYPNGWALGRCKWCKVVEPFRQYPQHNSFRQVVPTTLAEKRRFLSSIGITIHSSRWDVSEKEALINSVRKIGIHQTAKKFDVSPSAVGNWAKGLSPYKANSDKYSKEFKLRCVGEYERHQNFYGVAKKMGIPRSTLQRWVKVGI